MSQTTDKKKILILGITGMMGHQAWRYFHESTDLLERFEIYGTLRKSQKEFQDSPILKNIFCQKNVYENISLDSVEPLLKILNQLKPDIILNCAGITIRKQDALKWETSFYVNSYIPQFLVQWADQNNSKVIQLSTDCVFDGSKPDAYVETDLTLAHDLYGQSKILGEVKSAPHLTLRFPFIGREIENPTELVEWALSQQGKEIKGFTQAFYSGSTTRFVARELVKIIIHFSEIYGVYHISTSPISKYELLCKLNKKFNLNMKVEAVESKYSNKSLNCDKYKKLTGYIAPSWNEIIDDLYEDRAFYESLKG